MKKLLLTAAAILATLNMYGQGTFQGGVNFNSIGSLNFVTDPTGARAAGSSYRVGLWWGQTGVTDDGQLTQIGASANMLTGGNAGYFNNLGRTITYQGRPGIDAAHGATLTFQVRGWETRGGQLLTWDAAVAAGAMVGKSRMFDFDTASDQTTPPETKPDIGFAPGFAGGFQIVPEPSTIALGLLGAGALLMLRRRK
jgi:hypothetical protein